MIEIYTYKNDRLTKKANRLHLALETQKE